MPSVQVSAGGYGNLFVGNVSNGHTYGIIARISITKTDGSAIPAANSGATLWDLAYLSKSDSAIKFAMADNLSTKRARGRGAGFYVTINAPTLSPTNADGVGFWIGASDDNFSGADCSQITDYAPSDRGNTSGRLQGAYGQQFNISVPIRNIFSTIKTFRIMIGTMATEGSPFAYYNGDVAYYTGLYSNKYFIDVMEVTVSANATSTVTFTTVVPNCTSTSYLIGARTV